MPPDDELPPELRTVSREELRKVFAAATRLAAGLMRNRDAADRLVSDTFEALLTTRRWDPARGSLERHVLGALTSIRHHGYASKAPARDETARRAFQREELGTKADSPETKNLDHAERETAAEGAVGELEALVRSVSGQPLVLRVLDCRRQATEDGTAKKPREIAAELGVDVSEVYKANDVLREHLRAIRKRRGGGEGEEE